MFLISKRRLTELLAAELKLCALNGGGVDNWGGYGESLSECLDEFAEEYGLERDDLTFIDAAEHMVSMGRGF